MKDFILKNKKIVCAGLMVLSILFLILVIANLSSTERDAYQSMYDANSELYETYINAAQKSEQYGYSSKAQTYYSEAYALDDKIERYEKELSSLNIQVVIFALLMLGSTIGTIWLLKKKENIKLFGEHSETASSSSEGEII